MYELSKVLLGASLVLLLSTDLMAQRGGRGQGKGSRNNQAAQSNQGQNGFGQGSRGDNSRGQNGNGQSNQGHNSSGQGQRPNGRGQGGQGQSPSNNTLTEQDRSELMLMREEEKLARDVYIAMNKKWGATIFANISRAESKHMQAVAGLLSRYQIPDPVVSNTPGSFTNPRFQQLYQSLVGEGSSSLVDALKVGLKIEEMDIADLRNAIQTTSNSDIRQVFQNLEQGSRNHLRAFASQLKKSGGTYVSTQLSQVEFDSIANSANGQGGGNRSQANGNGRGQQGPGQQSLGQQGRGQAQSGNQTQGQRGGRGQGSGGNQGQGQRGNQGNGRGGNGRGR